MANRAGERGFSLIFIALTLVVMLGMCGLAIDLGRMFVYKSELQTFADASAMAAITKMDGSQTGLQGANSTALTGPDGATLANKVNFDSTTISTVTTSYATSFAGTYDNYATASSPAINTYRFIKVQASANVSLSFLPALPGIPTAYTVSASAIAGQQPQSSAWNGGLVPFAPGSSYTLKWGNGNTTNCAGDAGFNPNLAPSGHGFVDLGQGNGNSSLRAAIEYGGYPNASSSPSSVSVGTVLGGVPGNRGASIFGAMSTRASQDTDIASTTWAQYQSSGTGNGRRIVTAPIVDPATWAGNGANANATVVGFGNFLIDPSYSGSSGPICATYIGPGDLTGTGSGGTNGTTVYSNILYQ
jgi:Flp pilus assembly protein TadG